MRPWRRGVVALGIASLWLACGRVQLDDALDTGAGAVPDGAVGRRCVIRGGGLIDLGVPPGDLGSVAVAINDDGLVLVRGTTGGAFVFRPAADGSAGGRRSRINPPAGVSSVFVVGMSAGGRVIGSVRDTTAPVVWDGTLATTIAIPLGLQPPVIFVQAEGITAGGSSFGFGRLQTCGQSCMHAVIWPAGNLTAPVDVGTLDDSVVSGSIALAGNAHDVVVGTSGGGHGGFIWDGAIHDLGSLGGATAAPTAINDAGQVVGASATADGAEHAFLWTAGTMRDLGTLFGGSSSAVAINSSGQVAGNSDGHAFFWSAGTMTDIGTLGGQFSHAVAINDAGQVVGGAHTTPGADHAFVWQAGAMRDLGTLGGPVSGAYAINAAGYVIGSSDSADDSTHAFLGCAP